MPKTAGVKTGVKTRIGRDVYKTSSGENISEKSVTLQMDDKIINVPSVHDGKIYTRSELEDKLNKNEISPTSYHKSFEEAGEEASFRSSTLMDDEETYGKKLSGRQGSFKHGGYCRGAKIAIKGTKFKGVF